MSVNYTISGSCDDHESLLAILEHANDNSGQLTVNYYTRVDVDQPAPEPEPPEGTPWYAHDCESHGGHVWAKDPNDASRTTCIRCLTIRYEWEPKAPPPKPQT